MRPRNLPAREQLATALARRAAVGAADLAIQLGVSLPTLHRLLQEQAASVVASGNARRRRYAWRRALRGRAEPLPLVEVDAAGRAQQVAQLSLLQPQGSWLGLAGSAWPLPDESRDGWWAGLPYVMQDMRPQGYLGRQLARTQHTGLGVAPNPEVWGDDDVVHVLAHIGDDASGNLILGEAAFARWQAQRVAPAEPISPRATANTYARLADQAVALGVAGSSAAGEFPKFPALRDLAGSDTPHVLVKFSGADGSAAVRRWADLLVCEHLALQTLAALPRLAGLTGPTGARSRILASAGRTLLEVERFDRHGLFGRSPLVSLATLDAAFVGDGSGSWPRLAGRLQALGLLAADTVVQVQHLWWFGRLIANTDMHLGNLSFRPQAALAGAHLAGPLALAPAYDMLPMAYAPLRGGEVPPRDFDPALPGPTERGVWLAACALALQFWRHAAGDARVSDPFRALCAANAARLDSLAAGLR